MVDFSYQINNLVIVLVAIQLVLNDARRINQESNESLLKSFNDTKLLTDNHRNSSIKIDTTRLLPTALSTRKTEARESKYSYFYVGAWIWHIPLWFTLWFSFYVFFNVIRAIYGHKIDPDDYARRKREIGSPSTPSPEELNKLTEFAMKSIEKFQNKRFN